MLVRSRDCEAGPEAAWRNGNWGRGVCGETRRSCELLVNGRNFRDGGEDFGGRKGLRECIIRGSDNL